MEVSTVNKKAFEEKNPKQYDIFVYDNDSNGGCLNKFNEIQLQIKIIHGAINLLENKFSLLKSYYDEFTDYNYTMDRFCNDLHSYNEDIKLQVDSLIRSAYEQVTQHLKQDETLMDDINTLVDLLGGDPSTIYGNPYVQTGGVIVNNYNNTNGGGE